MKDKHLRMTRATRVVLIGLLLGVAGMMKSYAYYSFSAVCETGQTLYYTITDYTNHFVALTCPGTASTNGCWSGYTRPTGDIVFSESVQNDGVTYTVTSIDNYAFYNCSDLTGSLTIPNSVTSIGWYAFCKCTGFTGSLTIPNSVTSIEGCAFCNCTGFTGNLTIPNSVTSIGESAFSGCSGFTGSLTISNSVTTIDNSVFENCSGFTGILNIPNSVTAIGNHAFSNCSGFNGDLTIPNSVTSISWSAFYGCSGFTGSLTIPNSVTSISDYAFSNCSGFTGDLTIPNSVTAIGNGAFSYCSGFTGDLTIPNSVTSIGWYAFCKCTGFTGSLTIPNSVTSIGESAFSGCSGFTGSLSISNSVTTLDRSVFQNCSGFTGNLTIPSSVTKIEGEAFSGCSGFNGSLTIPNSVTSIGWSAFYGCSSFTGSLTIPNSVTTIGNSAFYNCHGFTGSLSIPNSVTSIGENAFRNCNGFTGNLTIGNSVTKIDGEAFSCCSGFTGNLTIGNSVTTIGGYAFYGCSFTGSLTIPNSVTSIGWSAFENCSGFTGNLVIPNSVTSLGGDAFGGCSGFTGDLVIPNSLTTIEYDAFYHCSGFNGRLTIPHSVTSIGGDAFSGCDNFTSVYYTGGIDQWCNILFSSWNSNPLYYAHNLYVNNELVTDLVIPESVTEINSYAFHGATCLLSLTIGNSVTAIGDYAFNDCSGFTGNLTISNSVTTIGIGAFSGCRNFTGRLTIPNSVTEIGNSAFQRCSGFNEAIILGTNPPSLGNNGFDNTYFPIYVPYELLNTYKNAENWSNYESRIYPMAYKTITGYGTGNDKWAFIASPLTTENLAPTAVENMIPSNDNYDLYRFNQSAELEWENWKSHANNDDHYHFNLENGQGYLYANAEDVNLVFKGDFNENTSQSINLIYEAGKELAGWNLVGNPFPVTATVTGRSYYVMNEAGTGINPEAVSAGGTIAACTGIMVKATATGQTVTFAKPSRATTDNNGLVQIVVATSTGQVVDKAIVSFNEGDQLGKFYFGEQNANIYIPQGVEEYAIATSNGQGEMPLNLKAKENGEYTISVNPENVEMNYLHLIDNMTGADIDLLATPSYTFNAKTTDYESRFCLVFSAIGNENGGNENAPFAFVSNGQIIITGIDGDVCNATLQMVDVMGHVLVCRDAIIASPISTTGMASGVYVLRLVCGDNVRTQKMVIQ